MIGIGIGIGIPFGNNDNLKGELVNYSNLINNSDINISTGLLTTGDRTVFVQNLSVKPGTTWVFKRPVAVGSFAVRKYDSTGNYIGTDGLVMYVGVLEGNYKFTSDTHFMNFVDEANTLEPGYSIKEL